MIETVPSGVTAVLPHGFIYSCQGNIDDMSVSETQTYLMSNVSFSVHTVSYITQGSSTEGRNDDQYCHWFQLTMFLNDRGKLLLSAKQ